MLGIIQERSRIGTFLVLLITSGGNIFSLESSNEKEWVQFEEERTDATKDQMEVLLQNWILEEYNFRANEAWNTDYSSIDAFKRSVEPNRERWRAILNPPVFRKTGPLKKEPHPYLEDIQADWVVLPLGPVKAEGILVFPPGASKEKPVPIVIVQHGKEDRIAYWPHVVDEFNIAETHYEKLSITDRIEIDVFEGGHEALPETGIPFLVRWLNH